MDAQAGDRDAFGELFERYRPAIVALAMRRVRNADEAEELDPGCFCPSNAKNPATPCARCIWWLVATDRAPDGYQSPDPSTHRACL